MTTYRDNNWVHSSVFRIAFQIASIDFQLQNLKTQKFVENHQATKTLEKPQTVKGGKASLTGFHLKFVTAQHIMLAGEAFWLLDDRLNVNGAPTTARILSPGTMQTRKNDWGDIEMYEYYVNGKRIDIDPLDVVHFRLPDPNDPTRGLSPTQSIRYAIDTKDEADQLNYNRLRNNAQPGGTLSTEQKLSEDQIDLLRKQWEKKHGGKNNGRVAFLSY